MVHRVKKPENASESELSNFESSDRKNSFVNLENKTTGRKMTRKKNNPVEDGSLFMKPKILIRSKM